MLLLASAIHALAIFCHSASTSSGRGEEPFLLTSSTIAHRETSVRQPLAVPFRLPIRNIEDLVASLAQEFSRNSQGLHYGYPDDDSAVTYSAFIVAGNLT